MNESDRIIKLFKDLYEGHPWLDVTFMDTLKNMSAEDAAKKPKPGWNSIWEIVNHVISWRLAVLERIEGLDNQSPANNYFTPITDESASAWTATLASFDDSQEKWINYLKQFTVSGIDDIPDTRPFTKYELIHGILHHDAYHLGQIRLVAKFNS